MSVGTAGCCKHVLNEQESIDMIILLTYMFFFYVQVLEGNATTHAGNSTVMYLNSTLFIMATNANRVSVSYSTVYLNITYNGLPLDNTSMPPFDLPAHGNVSIGTPLSVNNLEFFQTDGQHLLKDAKDNHLPIRLTGQTTANIRVFGIQSNVKVEFVAFSLSCKFSPGV